MRLKIGLWLLLALGLAGCGWNGNTAVTPTHTATITTTPKIGIAFVTQAPPTAAILQTTPTQLPTPTITATATAIIHSVQAGETLLGIAIQHGTTTEQIQVLNPDINPRLLLIGQGIVLPQPTAVNQISADTAVPIQIEALQIHAYRAPVGSVWLVGELLNTGELPVENVQVEVGLLNAAGELLATAVAWAATPIIQPDTTAPFAILLNEPPPFEFQSVSIIGGQTAVALGSRYLDLAVTEVTLHEQGSSIVLTGLIQNSGSETAVQPTLIASFYDAQENIIGYSQHTLPDVLEPGQSVRFNLETAAPGGTAVSVKTFLIGQRLP